MIRCPWLDTTKEDYVRYHDEEWGKPVYDDRVLFEFIILESAQAGLSWYTILKRREGYRDAFAQFDPQAVAQFDDAKIEELVTNTAIIRHRGKIAAAVTNAQVFIQIQHEFGSFSAYLWGFVDNKPLILRPDSINDYAATSPLSDRISKDLKKRGMRFFGSTICYSYLQACGVINEHSANCLCA
ncbi:DNA-3-methyladenine glycosylase I [Vibrio viridaestus]|uniref:DNA-3-methyladenine glycosylase I n=1 Tax=Vibrio viridaestus TaxID=2487322 RepID=A0A3N9THJ0_9VIBR|nr:DNA-3-methyladenine glycosylase I [Vibrio viridaestus]RQW63727.1 DNA-3-methyladenine glycosylase I [Vibrio viridaestus]